MNSFENYPLSPESLQSMKDMGFETPSDIQNQTWNILLNEKTDFIGLAATGTGKTAAFAVPMIEQLDMKEKVIQALILCPTRELALQVSGQISLLGKQKRVEALPIYGGASYTEQFRGLHKGLPVVVGTPGRLVDHINKGTIKLDQVKMIILDEADEMISMGFKEDLEAILSQTKKESAQVWLFSATMSKEVRRVADQYLKNPKQAEVNRTEKLPSKINQQFFVARESNKPEILCKIIDMAENFYGIIFCQTKALVSDLTQYLNEHGYKADSLHGDKDQKSRERTMQAFRDHKVKILVCTDVASRGLDVKDISHVINYSIPRELESYVHRVGRTARSGKEGFAFSLVAPSQIRMIDRVEKVTKSKITEGRIPSRKEVTAKKIAQFLPGFQTETPAAAKALDVLDDNWKTALAGMTAEQVAARFIAMAHPTLFAEIAVERKEYSARDDRRQEGGRSNDRGGEGRRYDRPRGDRRDGDRREGGRDGGGRSYGRREDAGRGERREFSGERRPRTFEKRSEERTERRTEGGGERPPRREGDRPAYKARSERRQDERADRPSFREQRKPKTDKAASESHPGSRFTKKPKKNHDFADDYWAE